MSWSEPRNPAAWCTPRDRGSWPEPRDKGSWPEPRVKGSWPEPRVKRSWPEPRDRGSWPEPRDKGSWPEPPGIAPRSRRWRSDRCPQGASSAPLTRRRALALVLGAGVALAGCGFRPVYGPAGSGTALDGATVVAQGGGPNDFTLARALQDRLGAPGATPRFRLATSLSVASEQVAVTTAQSVNRFNLIGVVDYTLTDTATGNTVRTGRVDGFNSYSAVGTSLAVRTAREDATERLMVILADRVMLDLVATPALLGGSAH